MHARFRGWEERNETVDGGSLGTRPKPFATLRKYARRLFGVLASLKFKS
jgi:hypothetical protein